MAYFLTVTKRDGSFDYDRKKFTALEAALALVSKEYLADCDIPHRWSGYFALRDGELTRLYLSQASAAPHLRDNIARIDIMSERGLLEAATHESDAAQ